MESNKVYIDTTAARELIKKRFPLAKAPSLPTLLTWVKEFNLGYKFVGRWKIDKEELIKFLLEQSK